MLGIFIGRATGSLVIAFVAAIAVATIVYSLSKKRRSLLLPMFSLLGFVILHNSFAVTNQYLENAANSHEFVRITGLVTDVSLTRSDWTRLTLRSDEQHGASVNIRLFVYTPEDLRPGQQLTVYGVLQHLSFPRNPGGYNEFQHLRSRGYEYKMFADEYILGSFSINPIRNPILTIRNFRLRTATTIAQIYPERSAAIVKALIIGANSTIEPEIRDIYRDAGIFHILAVSGLHVGMVAAFTFMLLGAFKINERRAGFVTLAVLAFYCIFTGAGPATIRAVIMCSIIIIGKIMYRNSNTLNSAAFAAFLLLLNQPLLLWDVGFIYTFTAVCALSSLTPVVQKAFDNIAKRHKRLSFLGGNTLKAYCCSCIATFMATMPLTAYFFFQISPIAIVVNIVLVPTVAFVVLSGFLSVFAGLFSVTVASFFAGTAHVLIMLYEFVCTHVARLPLAAMPTGRPPVYVIIPYALFLILLAYLHNKKIGTKMKRVVYIAAPAAIFVLAMFWQLAPRPPVITFLDVGQGDATVLTQNRQAIIIDGGGNMWRELGETAGMRVIMPYLDYRGIGQVYAAFISHPHEDHAMGLVELMQAGRLNKLVMADVQHPPYPFLQIIYQTAEENGTQIIYMSAGDIFRFMDFTLEVIYPPQGISAPINDLSKVLRVTINGASLLFTGDIEALAERNIVATANHYNICLNVDILKVPHHGSRSSSSYAFLRAVSPTMAMAGISERNPHGHPHPIVVERYEYFGIKFITTAEEGAIIIRPRDRGLTYTTMRAIHEQRHR